MKRICVNVTNELDAALKERAKATGVLQSEIIRRAIAETLALDGFVAKNRAVTIAMLEREPEQAVHFPGFLPAQKASAKTVLLVTPKAGQ
jgi:hypothetical protein